MSDPDDMDKPVTKRELLAAFDNFLGALMLRLDERFATKRDLDERFATKRDLDERFATKRDLEEMNRDLRQLISAESDDTRREMRALVRTQDAQHRLEIGAVADRYRDLPERVGKLEAAVFPPTAPVKRQRRR